MNLNVNKLYIFIMNIIILKYATLCARKNSYSKNKETKTLYYMLDF
jgi:hypothetical protein